MLWFVVWTLLVLGALVTLGLLARQLWHKAQALGAELTRAGEVTAALAPPPGPEPVTAAVPGVLGDPEALRRARATRERVRTARRERADRRLDRVAARWRALGLVR